ncbi:hypothetical protein BA195_05320 [Tenacibaculum soleae]|uniref:DUF4890 domain-containing protein n=1 Tax=Tenacibaculum soleae TaxID=447689 RepID=A0A1B9Y2T9_9FLAO|nr:hypothetical protein [Tenacibaculum soleae]OCK44110.1 hypothetical protein BA195_05320 [Tenacibaculum soleae]
MKKIIAVLVVALSFILTTQAQKGKKNKLERLSVAQQTELALKKMTLKLDLTTSQQNQIKPLLAEKIAKRKTMHEQRKAIRESGKKRVKLSADERFERKNKALDSRIAFKTEMKRILDKQQFERFEKISKKRAQKGKKKMKNRKRKKAHEKK